MLLGLCLFAILFALFGLAPVGPEFVINRLYAYFVLQLLDYGQAQEESVKKFRKQIKSRRHDSNMNTEQEDEEEEQKQDKLMQMRNRSMSLHLGQQQHNLRFDTITEFAKLGIEAILFEDVTQRFAEAEPETWNLLTRADRNYRFASWKMFSLWVFGLVLRYLVFLPIRMAIFVVGILVFLVFMLIVGFIPNSEY